MSMNGVKRVKGMSDITLPYYKRLKQCNDRAMDMINKATTLNKDRGVITKNGEMLLGNEDDLTLIIYGKDSESMTKEMITELEELRVIKKKYEKIVNKMKEHPQEVITWLMNTYLTKKG